MAVPVNSRQIRNWRAISWRMSAPELVGVGLSELPTRIPHGLISQHDPAFGHQLLDVPVTEAEAEIQPHTVADDLHGEAMTLIPIYCGSYAHGASMSYEAAAGKRVELI